MTRKIVVVMPGARMNYAVPRIFYRAGFLDALLTDIYLLDGPLFRLAKAAARVPGLGVRLRVLLGRHHKELVGAKVISDQANGLRAVLQRRRAKEKVSRRSAKHVVSNLLADLFEFHNPAPGTIVFGFHETSLETFERARRRGLTCIYEQSIAARPYAQKLLAQEIESWGAWYKPEGLPSLEAMQPERSAAEWVAASVIIAGSDFVRETLIDAGVPSEKIRVIPYGVSLPAHPPSVPDYDGSRPLRLLFAGHVHLRKGAHHLLRALDLLPAGQVEITFAGSVGLRPEIVEKYADRCRFLGRVPRLEMNRLYEQCDVFVLPSLIEGSATVTYEALSHGLPVIVTPNAGSVVKDTVDGQVIPVGDAEALAGAIARYLDTPTLIVAQAEAARAAAQKISFHRYEAELLDLIKDVMSGHEGSGA